MPHPEARLAGPSRAAAVAPGLAGPRPGAVHVWSLRLDQAPDARARLESYLSLDERGRARRFMRATDRNRYACAHGLLRLVLSAYAGDRPEDVALERGPGGKPRLVGLPGPRFNLSHADGLGLVAVSADREVGVDIEKVRDVGDVTELARTCFSPAERAALAAVPAPLRLRAFFAGWTRKEAFLKAVGAGLSLPLDSFDVALAPGAPARLLRVRGVPGGSERYTLRSVRAAPGYAAAVVAAGTHVAIRWQPWEMLAVLAGAADGAARTRERALQEPAGRARGCGAARPARRSGTRAAAGAHTW
jgi:4'-phosphopantetheinyl transferase